jgi:metal-dependent amidase/aminoacylase/carboxypeptidase family protein
MNFQMPGHILTAGLVLVLLGAPCPGGEPARTGESVVQEQAAQVHHRIEADYPRLEALYKHLHAHPELSLQEVRTAARLARELREAGFTVTENVGGHGVVGVLRNGKGPTVLVRTDMDALPVVERTGLPYASTVRTRDAQGREVGVMHACGHDMHMTLTQLLHTTILLGEVPTAEENSHDSSCGLPLCTHLAP